MIKLSQENRQAVIETPLGTDVLMLQHFSGSESLSRDFSYTITVLSEDAAIDGNALVGKRISVSYSDEENKKRHFNGFVSRFEYNRQIEEPFKAAAYTIEMVPWLWFLRHNSDCQIFQDMSAPDIIKQIFNDLGYNDFRNELTESYPTREYCVQYNESDFNFVCRLMEEEGIFFYFEHTKDKHTLVMCDSPSGYFDLSETEVHYTPVGQAQFKQLTNWRHVYEFRPGKVVQKDFNFKKPTDALATDLKSKVKFEESSKLEVYRYPGLYEEEGNGKRLTRVRLEEIEAEHDHVVGSGAYLKFTPGGKFEVQKHMRPGEEGRSYALIEVHTEISSNLGFDSGDGDDFRNTFRCIPAETTFRPPRQTPKPVVEGPQTAIIATDGQEIVVDEHARVKVQFHWDRYGQNDINSSCWMRVSQHHAGAGWGMIDIPRKDEEVIVSFLNGDPDRPIITGRVYNGDNQPPFGLKGAGSNAENKTRRGNMTKSYESSGFNEMSMDDTAGEEQIRIHAQYDMNTTVLHDQTLDVGNDRTKNIGNDETMAVANNQSLSVGNNRENAVGNNHDESVANNQSVTVGSNQSTSVGGSYSLSVASSTSTEVGSSASTSVASNAETVIGQNSSEQVGMKKEIVCGQELTQQAGMEVKISAGMKVTIEAGGMLELKCGASSISMNPAMVTISGPLVKINC